MFKKALIITAEPDFKVLQLHFFTLERGLGPSGLCSRDHCQGPLPETRRVPLLTM